MRRLLCLFLSFFVLPAFAVTSQSYVDAAVAPLQDEIPAVNENAVLTNTGTAGEVGTKQIYDSNADYASQQNALITAETFNAAVQNAIDNEYVCIEWLGDNHDNAHCLLYQIRPAYNKSKNLFNKNDPRIQHGRWDNTTRCQTGVSMLVHKDKNTDKYFISGPIPVTPNTTYTITKTGSGYNPSFFYLDENYICLDAFANNGRASITFTVPDMPNIKYIMFPGAEADIDTIQFEEGSMATPYQPYGENTWLPEL